MNTIKNLERLQKLHFLIKNESTGPPSELAQMMKVSERLIYNLIEQLKDFDAKISYDRRRKTYYYCDNFQIRLNISFSVTRQSETIELFQGSYLDSREGKGILPEHLVTS